MRRVASGTERFERNVVRAIRALREGEVASYGEIAAEAGYPGAARAVGSLLRRTTLDVPWWRVMRADGQLVAPSRAEQARLLRAEGHVVVDGRIKLGRPGPQRSGGVSRRARGRGGR